MEPQVFEKVKVGIAVPTAGMVRAGTVFSLMKLVGVLAQMGGSIWPEAKETGLTVLMREGSGIAPNREKMVMEAKECGCTHILFVDDDMEFEPEAFVSLAKRRLPIVVTNYRMKFPPAEFTALHLDRNKGRMQTTQESTGLEPCDYAGFGLSLIDLRVFDVIPKPWFLGTYIEGVYTTEDLPFFYAARAAGYVAFVDQDASKHIAHIGIHKYLWHQNYAPDKNSATV